MYENVRHSLEQCDVDADIQLFVTTKSTGMERPGIYKYCMQGVIPKWLISLWLINVITLKYHQVIL